MWGTREGFGIYIVNPQITAYAVPVFYMQAYDAEAHFLRGNRYESNSEA
jgi:hypothetical protein